MTAPTRHRVVHAAIVVGKHRARFPACGISRTRWPSIEITTSTDQADVTCRRPGCATP